MKLNEIIDAIHKKRDGLKKNHINFEYEPKLELYIDNEYYIELHREISSKVDPFAYEFRFSNTILGYKVWRVLNRYQSNGDDDRHPAFRIVNLDKD